MIFSILIAHYNNARFLAAAINSVLEQTYTDWEIILVDDASTDEFEEIIIPYEADTRIKVLRNKKNCGCGFTKRRCAANATGQILAFLDPDDTLEPRALQVMAEAHRYMPDHSLIHSTHFVCDEKLSGKRISDTPRAIPENTSYIFLSDGRIHHFASFKKEFYDRTEGISPENRKAVDQDLYYKMEETGPIHFINIPLYNYRIHGGSISNCGKEKQAAIAHYNVIEKACIRRMHRLNSGNKEELTLRKKYKTRLLKIKVFNHFRKGNWLQFSWYLILFPFGGGWENMQSYVRKFPKQGWSLIRKSLVDNYEIKA